MRTAYAALSCLTFLAACANDVEQPAASGDPDVPESGDAAEDDGPPDFSQIMSPAEIAALAGERGVTVNAEGAYGGYTLVAPLNSTKVHLLALDGEIFHTWETNHAPGGWCYLQDDGTLLHAGRQDEDPKFKGGGIGGVIQRFAPDGEVLWRFDFADESRCQHHDIEPLPNGNLLFIAWERQPAEAAIARGRDPRGVGAAGLWSDAVYEVRPTPPLGGDIVWSWHAWDHLVQDVDPEKPNYGALSDHPHRIDINGAFEAPDEMTDEERAEEEERQADMAALGYGGGATDDGDSDDGPPASDWDDSGDWTHTNAVDYHPELDLIVLSSPELCEIFAIDHSTTRDEARGSTGGRYGRGGDLLWRWGNPAHYGMGTDTDKKLFYQHDPQWLGGADDLRLLVFNNGGRRPDGNYSSVLELAMPFDAERGFLRDDGAPFGPTTAVWAYSDPETFFSAFISGATRLPNGNTLVCSGAPGRIFELTPDREIVWDYSNDLGGDVKPPEHAGNAPPFALYRAQRYAPDYPGVVALGR